jgi:oligosaccharide repeat unit polymerase
MATPSYKIFQTRPQSSLLFYCRPLNLFVCIWLVMLASLRFQITYPSYPHFSLAVFIFALSLSSFVLGHFVVRLLHVKRASPRTPNRYQLDVAKLRRFIFRSTCAAVAIILLNLILSGLPPAFGFFGFSTKSYSEYGKLEQVLFPLLMVVFVNAFLETSKNRKILYASFAFLAMFCYVARGVMLIMLLQALIVFSIRTSMKKRKIYLVSICAVIGAAFLVDLIGSNRTTDAILFAGMQIKPQFQQWPTVCVWIISYISSPLSNLCWIVDTAHFEHVTWSFAHQLIPSFWSPINSHKYLLETSNIVDGVSTYLINYFLDFSYFGIFLINVSIGMVSGYYSSVNRLSRRFLTSSVFLSCIGFMFFFDFFIYLQILIELGLQALAQWYFLKELLPSRSNARAELVSIE